MGVFFFTDTLVYMRCGKTEGKAYIDRQLVGILHHIIDIGGCKEPCVHAELGRYESPQTFIAYLKHQYPGAPGEKGAVYAEIKNQSDNPCFYPYTDQP